LSKNLPFPPFEQGGNRKSPFVKGDLEGFSSAQHDFDETLEEMLDIFSEVGLSCISDPFQNEGITGV
jgi:hypothetical protein